MGRKHRKKRKHQHNRKNSKQKLVRNNTSMRQNIQSPNKQHSVSKLPAEPAKEPAVKDDVDSTPTCLLAPEDYCNIFSVSKKIKNQGLVKPIEKQRTKEKIQSEEAAPTALIAPLDYKNFFSNQNPAGKGKQPGSIQPLREQRIAPVTSDTPTAIIAPNDYQCFFSKNKDKQNQIQIGNIVTSNNVGKQLNQAPKVQSQRPPTVERVPSDTPTALIAPADYVCIYKNPQNQQKNDDNRPND